MYVTSALMRLILNVYRSVCLLLYKNGRDVAYIMYVPGYSISSSLLRSSLFHRVPFSLRLLPYAPCYS
jgi:hypothetical protein